MNEQPKALVCGMLERDGRILFLKRKEEAGEGIELPAVYGSLRADPLSQLAEAFKKQTGIKAEVGPMAIESRHEHEGAHIPCLVFLMKQLRDGEPDPATVYSGFEWLTLEDARMRRHANKGRWLSEPMLRVD